MNKTAADKGIPPIIWTPKVIYSDRKLSANAKFILSEILNLLKLDNRYCYASNTHFANMFGLDEKNVSYHIQQLKKEGWIKCEKVKICTIETCPLKNDGYHRHIYPSTPLSSILDAMNGIDRTSQSTPLVADTRPPSGVPLTPYPQILEPYIENNIENNTKSKDIVSKLTRQTTVESLCEKKEFGNQDISLILSALQEALHLPQLDLSVKVNRQYAWNLLRKSKTGTAGVLWLINLAAEDEWFRYHITSVRDLWNNQVKIASSARSRKKEVAVYVET
jgi:DNA-binding Lrp family transcriptional regulator